MLMKRGLFAILLALMPVAAWGQCQLCPPARDASSAHGDAPSPPRTLGITIETALDFSRLGGTRGGGSVAIDERSGSRLVNGLVDLGGFTLKGSARVTGEPLRRVRVSMPASIGLTTPDGGSAEVVDLRTDLPPDPHLDAQGMLGFSFAGRLLVGGNVSGELRGRIPVTVDYD